jgi:hypothetical protein
LNRDFWSTKTFKYSVEDLSQVLSNLSSKIPPYANINGTCEPDANSINIYRETENSSFNVQMVSKCYLNVRETKLIEITINLNTIVFPKFFEDSFDVWMRGYLFNVT